MLHTKFNVPRRFREDLFGGTAELVLSKQQEPCRSVDEDGEYVICKFDPVGQIINTGVCVCVIGM